MAEKIEAGEDYRGMCGILKDGNWLSADTIPWDRDTVLQIERVVRRKTVEFIQPGKKGETKHGYGSLKFVGREKELGLNSTNIRTLAVLFGPDTSKWYGQRVALYVDPTVKAFGQLVPAVRIRAKRLDASKARPVTSAPAAETPADPERAALLTRIENASTMLKLDVLGRDAAWSTHCGTLKPSEATLEQLGRLADNLEADAMQRGEVA